VPCRPWVLRQPPNTPCLLPFVSAMAPLQHRFDCMTLAVRMKDDFLRERPRKSTAARAPPLPSGWHLLFVPSGMHAPLLAEDLL
jgi:hypothetical protein